MRAPAGNRSGPGTGPLPPRKPPGRRPKTATRFVSLSLGLSLATAASAQTVHTVSLSADLASDDGSAEVTVEIDFAPGDAAGVRIELLGFGNGRTDGFFAGGADGSLVRFDERSGSRAWVVIARDDFERLGLESGRIRDGVFEALAPGAPLSASAPAWRLRATYVVHGSTTARGETVRVQVPVLTVALPPSRDAGAVFHAGVRAPSSWSVSETFPTGLRRQPDGTWVVDLAVAPAVIGFRARTDGAWRPGVPLLLDVLAGAILLAALFIGGRHLRASA